MEQEIGFKTALWGFKKEDVLQCIESISAEKETIAADAEAIRAQLDELQQERDALAEKITEGNRLIEQLAGQVAEAQTRAADAESSSSELAERLRKAEESTRTYCSRLFTKEQQIIGLQKDNESLAQRLTEQQQMLEEARAAAEKAGEFNFQENVAAVRDDLVQVDEKITALAESIRRTTDSLSRALAENQPTAAAARMEQNAAAGLPLKSAGPQKKSRSQKLSELLLDKLADMLSGIGKSE